MTWEEFKTAAEEQGVLDEDEIEMIDVAFPDRINVRRVEDASGALVTIT